MPDPITTRGVLLPSQRSNGVNRDSYNKNVTVYSPLGLQYPSFYQMEKRAKAAKETVDSRVRTYFQQGHNSLSGAVTDVYTNTGLSTAYVSGGVINNTVYVKVPTSAFSALRCMQERWGVEIVDSTSGDRIGGYLPNTPTVAADDGTYFALVLLDNDTNNALASSTLRFSVTGQGLHPVNTLGQAVNEHETPYTNYVQEMNEAHEISEDEYYQAKNINDRMDMLKTRKERESLARLLEKRYRAFLLGRRAKLGEHYMAGGYYWFLKTYESSNIVNWRTDTTFSASTDRVSSGTIPFLRQIAVQANKYLESTDTLTMLLSLETKNIITQCAQQSGSYKIDKSTNEFGMEIERLTGVGHPIELMVDALFNTDDSLANQAALYPTKWVKLCPFVQGDIKRIKWSSLPTSDERDGETYRTAMKGGWRVKETYEFHHIDSMFWLKGLGIEK